MKKGQHEEAWKMAEQAIQASDHQSVPTSLWVEARVIRAKSQILKKEIANAISSLKDICFILAPFPLDALPFIDSILMTNADDLYLSELESSAKDLDPTTDRLRTMGSKFQFSFA
jgi:hypothetical protein